MSLLQRATPRLERTYLRMSAGVAPDATPAEHEQRLCRYYAELRDRVAELPDAPAVSLLVDGRPHPLLAQTLGSVALQVTSRWDVVVHSDGAADPSVSRLRRTFPDRVAVLAGDLGAAAAGARGDYVGVLAPGDRLYPSALAEVARAFDLQRRLGAPLPDVAYSDERTIDEAGAPVGEPVFKPGWSPLLLRGGDYFGSLALFRREALARCGGFRTAENPGHDAALRVSAAGPVLHVPHVLVQRRSPAPTRHRTPLPLPQPIPTVSIVIPTRDRGAMLQRCLDSIDARSDLRPSGIVIVDNGTTQPAARRVLEQFAQREHASVIAHPGPFNFGRLCNAGARAAGSDVVVFLNNDTKVLSGNWLGALVAAVCQPGVGAAGAQLRYPDGRIQHAGLAGLAEAGTGHLFVARRPDREAPLGLASATREVLALTGACLAVDRSAFEAVGGFDEVVVPNEAGDVDLCLRLRERGLSCVYVPDAVLEHEESSSRGRGFHDFERFYLLRRWPADMLADPYLNPHLARTTRYAPDPRFAIPDVPAELFDRWLARDAFIPEGGVAS